MFKLLERFLISDYPIAYDQVLTRSILCQCELTLIETEESYGLIYNAPAKMYPTWAFYSQPIEFDSFDLVFGDESIKFYPTGIAKGGINESVLWFLADAPKAENIERMRKYLEFIKTVDVGTPITSFVNRKVQVRSADGKIRSFDEVMEEIQQAIRHNLS